MYLGLPKSKLLFFDIISSSCRAYGEENSTSTMHHSAIHATHLAHAIERGGDGVMGGSSACNTGEHWQEVDAADHGRDGDDERSISNPPMWKAMMLLATFCASLIFWGAIAVQIGAYGRWQMAVLFLLMVNLCAGVWLAGDSFDRNPEEALALPVFV